eukprot:2050339-Pyramimonas_sp.AAC.1
MLMSRGAMIHRFLHAAVLASNLWLDRRAAPENASTSKTSRSMGPQTTRRNLVARSMSPVWFFANFVYRAFDTFSGFAWMSAFAIRSSSLTTAARLAAAVTYTRM